MRQVDEFTRTWIIDRALPIINNYGSELTLRALHYRLVALGMTNSLQHYKRVIGAMTKARWEGLVSFSSFVDHDRSVEGRTKAEPTDLDDEIATAENAILLWMNEYAKNRWENQPYYVEVFIEKKALQGVFARPCSRKGVALCPCKGYPSLTYLDLAADRFREAMDRGQDPVILYFGDYDPSGEDIPRNIGDTLSRMGVDVEIKGQP